MPHLQAAKSGYDVLYSVFGAVDFTDPRELQIQWKASGMARSCSARVQP